MNKNNNNKNHPNPALIEKFLAVQEQELVMRGKELEVHQQNNNNTHEYALAALQANKEDREAIRTHQEKIIKTRYIFSGIILVFLFVLIGFCLYLNKDQIVLEILKAVLFFASGSGLGYAYAKKTSKNNDEQT
ncbi:TPA: hypothetical protein ACG3NN_002875 [Legionella pneumophila]